MSQGAAVGLLMRASRNRLIWLYSGTRFWCFDQSQATGLDGVSFRFVRDCVDILRLNPCRISSTSHAVFCPAIEEGVPSSNATLVMVPPPPAAEAPWARGDGGSQASRQDPIHTRAVLRQKR